MCIHLIHVYTHLLVKIPRSSTSFVTSVTNSKYFNSSSLQSNNFFAIISNYYKIFLDDKTKTQSNERHPMFCDLLITNVKWSYPVKGNLIK